MRLTGADRVEADGWARRLGAPSGGCLVNTERERRRGRRFHLEQSPRMKAARMTLQPAQLSRIDGGGAL